MPICAAAAPAAMTPDLVEQPEIAGRAVVETAPVSAGLQALHDHRVGTDRARRACLGGRGRRQPDGDARVVEALHILPWWTSNRE